MKKRLIVLTGAGISAESGLKTFRDSDGLWEEHRVEDVATPEAFARNPELVLRFYNARRRQVAEAQPNRAHEILAELEKDFRVVIITQNIDDLHERAGSTQVLHLHGEIGKKRSTAQLHDDLLSVPAETEMPAGGTAPDGGLWRPHIVWFGEDVPALAVAVHLASTADAFLVVGTSLQVYPAAGLIHYVPPRVPKYIVDKALPYLADAAKWHCHEGPATAGMEAVRRDLLQRFEKG